MKKLIALFTALTFALPFGVVFAQEKMETMEKKEEMTPMKETTKTTKKKTTKKKTKKKKSTKKKKEMKMDEMKKEEAAPMAPMGK